MNKMKYVLSAFVAILVTTFAAMFYTPTASADATYPYTSPVYTPMAMTAPVTLATGASTSNVFTLNNINTVAFRISGTCTGLTAAVQGTNDVGTYTNWTSLNFYPSPALGTAAPTIDADGSLTAAGLYKMNSSGLTRVRLNISALTGTSCVLEWTGSSAQFNGSFF